MDDFIDKLNTFTQTYGVTIIKVIAILVFGILFVKLIVKQGKKIAKKTNNTFAKFLFSIIEVLLYLLVFFWAARTAGLSTSSFVTLLASFSLALSLALQDSLSNLANGLIIVGTKPFKEGDHVIIGTAEGIVKEMRLFDVKLRTFDNQIITIPNKNVLSGNITNYSIHQTRRLDIVVPVSYGSDVELVKKTLLEVIKKYKEISKNPEPFVRLTNYGDSSLDFTIRVWVSNDNYWAIKFDLLEDILKAFDEKKIEIPYTHYDISIRKDGE